jgi:hypothetical protein
MQSGMNTIDGIWNLNIDFWNGVLISVRKKLKKTEKLCLTLYGSVYAVMLDDAL